MNGLISLAWYTYTDLDTLNSRTPIYIIEQVCWSLINNFWLYFQLLRSIISRKLASFDHVQKCQDPNISVSVVDVTLRVTTNETRASQASMFPFSMCDKHKHKNVGETGCANKVTRTGICKSTSQKKLFSVLLYLCLYFS